MPSLPAVCRTRQQPRPASVLQGTQATAPIAQVQLYRCLARSLKFGGGFPCRAPSAPSRSSPFPCPISGLSCPSDLFPFPTPSFPVSTRSSCLLLTTLWDHLPLEVDPCAHDRGGCSPYANCTKVAPGQRTCTCKDGYTGDGELCQGEAGIPSGCMQG